MIKRYKAFIYNYDNGAWRLNYIINGISILEAWRGVKKGTIQAHQIRFNDIDTEKNCGCLTIKKINGVEKIKLQTYQ